MEMFFIYMKLRLLQDWNTTDRKGCSLGNDRLSGFQDHLARSFNLY